MDVKAWVQEHFFPVVAVAATPAAEGLAQSRNGLSVVDVLRPYSYIANLNVNLKIGEVVTRVQEFRIRFHNLYHIFQPRTEVIDNYLSAMLQQSSQKYGKLEPFENLLAQIQSGSIVDFTPWFTEYREEFLRLLQFGDHESWDHPLACIFVIPSDVIDPVSHFEQLKFHAPQAPLMERDLMMSVRDPTFPRHYVLLHDGFYGGDDAWSRAQDNLAAIDKAYGAANCTLLRINTGKGDKASAGAPPDFWRRSFRGLLPGGGAGETDARPPEPPAGLGVSLSTVDVDSLRQFVKDFSAKTLIPRMAERVARLDAGITATRRGFRNQITQLFKKVGGTDSGPPADLGYPVASIQAQMRQLGDLAFLLRQWDLAAATYKLAAQDYQSANSLKWYAGAEEARGIMAIMDAHDDSDPVKHFTRAYENYARLPGKLPRMLATRAMLWCATYQMSCGKHAAASQSLMRAHLEEENARAALLLEQAAHALLRPKQPSVRKFAFHMVLAGLRYHSCGQKRRALHAYRQVMAVYHGKHWRFIEEHLNDVLGKQCREAGLPEQAVGHFMNLLDAAHRPVATQQHYLQQFLEVVRKLDVKHQESGLPLVEGLTLPLVSWGNVRVAFADQRCFGNAGAYHVPEETWLQLEAACSLPQDLSGVANWMDAKPVIETEEFNTCVSGEEVVAHVEFKNPLQVKLKLAGVRVLCQFEPIEPGTKTIAPPLVDSIAKLPSSIELQPNVIIWDQHITLHPGETLVEALKVRPLRPGWLRLAGVQWLLADGVHGRALFDSHGHKRRRMNKGRSGQFKWSLPPHRRLLFFVIPGMPRLDVSSDPIPSSAFQGELVRSMLTLRNVGQLPLRSIRVAVDHPDCAIPTTPEEPGSQPGGLLLGAGDMVKVTPINLPDSKAKAYLFRLPPSTVLQPGQALEWPLWLHPREEGSLEVNCVWCCEPEAPQQALRFRTLRLAHNISVLPLLKVAASVKPAPKDLYRHILQLDVEVDKESEAAVAVKQLSCCTAAADSGWRLSHPNGAAAADGSSWAVHHSLAESVSAVPGTPAAVHALMHPPAACRELDNSGPEPSLPCSVFHGPLAHFQQLRGRREGAVTAPKVELADPPVDVVMLWLAGPLNAATATAGEWQRQRAGAYRLYDCCSGVKPAPVRVVMESQASVKHDFRQHTMCVLPFTMLVRSCLAAPMSLRVEAGDGWEGPAPRGAWMATVQQPPQAPSSTEDVPTPPPLPAPQVVAGLAPSPEYLWCGTTLVNVTDLPPGADARAPLQVAVFKPGVYLIGDYSVTYTVSPPSGAPSTETRKGEAFTVKVDAI